MYVCCILYYIFHIIGSECSSDIRSVRGVTALRRHGRRTLHCCLQKRYRQKMVSRRATRKLSCNYICFNDLTCNSLKLLSSLLLSSLISLFASLSRSSSCFTTLTAFSFLRFSVRTSFHNSNYIFSSSH